MNLIAAGAMAFYFFAAVIGYAVHGRRRDTDNQFRDPVAGTHAFMVSLIVAEIGGWLVLDRRLRRRPDPLTGPRRAASKRSATLVALS